MQKEKLKNCKIFNDEKNSIICNITECFNFLY